MQLDSSESPPRQAPDTGSAQKSVRLEDTELIILSVAADRRDHIALPLAETITASPEQVKRKLLRLIQLGLLEEIPAKLEDGLWRKDEDDRHLTLRITSKGFAALGLDGQEEAEASGSKEKPDGAHARKSPSKSQHPAGATKKAGALSKANHRQSAPPNSSTRQSTRSKTGPGRSAASAAKKRSPAAHGSTSKTDRILKLLGHPKGATLDELRKASGWQAHSVRGFLSAVVKKKFKLKLVSEEDEKGRRFYRIRQKAKG